MPNANLPTPQRGYIEGGPSGSSYYIPNTLQPDIRTGGPLDPYASPAAAGPFPVPVYPDQAVWISELPEWDDLERAGHSLTALLAAFVFAVTSRWLYRTRGEER